MPAKSVVAKMQTNEVCRGCTCFHCQAIDACNHEGIALNELCKKKHDSRPACYFTDACLLQNPREEQITLYSNK